MEAIFPILFKLELTCSSKLSLRINSFRKFPSHLNSKYYSSLSLLGLLYIYHEFYSNTGNVPVSNVKLSFLRSDLINLIMRLAKEQSRMLSKSYVICSQKTHFQVHVLPLNSCDLSHHSISYF